jgi:hypothetical protein
MVSFIFRLQTRKGRVGMDSPAVRDEMETTRVGKSKFDSGIALYVAIGISVSAAVIVASVYLIFGGMK